MEMHQVRYFIAICEAGNFTRAAESAFVSQPSLTLAIKKLEEELGGPLFQRDRGGCRLTELGRLVEPDLRRIHEHSQAARSQAVRFTRLKKLPLRIGLMPTVGAGRLASALARFQKESPRVEVELVVEPEDRLMGMLSKGTTDLAICSPLEVPGPGFRREFLYAERYVVVFPARHRFARMDAVALADLQSEPWLDRLDCEMRESLKATLRERDLALYAAYRSNNVEWILRMVQGGIGVAIVPEFTVPEGLGWRPLKEPSIEREVAAFTSAAAAPKAETRALIKAVRAGVA